MSLSATVTAFFSITTPLSEKKHFCVNKGSRTKSWTQVMSPSVASRLRATRSKLMFIGAPYLFAFLTMSAVNCKAWTKHGHYGNELMSRKSTLDNYYVVKMTTSSKFWLWEPGRQNVLYMLVKTSWRWAPTTSRPAHKTDIRAYWPLQISHTTNPTPLSRLEAVGTNKKGHGYPPKHNLETNAAQILPNIWSSCNSGQQSARQLF